MTFADRETFFEYEFDFAASFVWARSESAIRAEDPIQHIMKNVKKTAVEMFIAFAIRRSALSLFSRRSFIHKGFIAV